MEIPNGPFELLTCEHCGILTGNNKTWTEENRLLLCTPCSVIEMMRVLLSRKSVWMYIQTLIVEFDIRCSMCNRHLGWLQRDTGVDGVGFIRIEGHHATWTTNTKCGECATIAKMEKVLGAEERLPGPCKYCGDVNYVLSFGGPDVCPPCDSGNFPNTAAAKRALGLLPPPTTNERLKLKTGQLPWR